MGDGLRRRGVVEAEDRGLEHGPAAGAQVLREPLQGPGLLGRQLRAARAPRPPHGVHALHQRLARPRGPLGPRADRGLPHRPVLVDLEGLRAPLVPGVALREGEGAPAVVEVQGVLQVLPVDEHEAELRVVVLALQHQLLKVPALEGHELGRAVDEAPHRGVRRHRDAEGLGLVEAGLPPQAGRLLRGGRRRQVGLHGPARRRGRHGLRELDAQRHAEVGLAAHVRHRVLRLLPRRELDEASAHAPGVLQPRPRVHYLDRLHVTKAAELAGHELLCPFGRQ
mmetsp:Transcript_107122/g.302925  ORF Transcript_107122/g.302925 Transcript_107122/m.302925 type:complete len:281 (-) Transcript_107122:394-1236(-)